MEKPNPWLLGAAAVFLVLTSAGVVLDRAAGLTGGLAFLGFASVVLAVLEPRLTGDVSASPTRLAVTLTPRATQVLQDAEHQVEAGRVTGIGARLPSAESSADEAWQSVLSEGTTSSAVDSEQQRDE